MRRVAYFVALVTLAISGLWALLDMDNKRGSRAALIAIAAAIAASMLA